MSIQSFRTKPLERLFRTGKSSKGSPARLTGKLLRLLDHLDAAKAKRDLNFAGSGFHELTGKRKGTYAWNVTANYRLTFRFSDGDAYNVTLEDYH